MQQQARQAARFQLEIRKRLSNEVSKIENGAASGAAGNRCDKAYVRRTGFQRQARLRLCQLQRFFVDRSGDHVAQAIANGVLVIDQRQTAQRSNAFDLLRPRNVEQPAAAHPFQVDVGGRAIRFRVAERNHQHIGLMQSTEACILLHRRNRPPVRVKIQKGDGGQVGLGSKAYAQSLLE